MPTARARPCFDPHFRDLSSRWKRKSQGRLRSEPRPTSNGRLGSTAAGPTILRSFAPRRGCPEIREIVLEAAVDMGDGEDLPSLDQLRGKRVRDIGQEINRRPPVRDSRRAERTRSEDRRRRVVLICRSIYRQAESLQLPRPRYFASYRAASARAIKPSTVQSPERTRVAPRLQPISKQCPSTSIGSATTRTRRSANLDKFRSSVSSTRIANSSPPSRAT